jgi:hypothetical protein
MLRKRKSFQKATPHDESHHGEDAPAEYSTNRGMSKRTRGLQKPLGMKSSLELEM